MDPDDLWCLYCQKQYALITPFLKHVSTEHRGVYENLAHTDTYHAAIAEYTARLTMQAQAAACENPF